VAGRALRALDGEEPPSPRVRDAVVLVAQLAPQEAAAWVDGLDARERPLVHGVIAARTDALDEAIFALDAYTGSMRAIGDTHGLMWGLVELGRALCMRGLGAESEVASEEGLRLAEAAGDSLCAGRALLQRAFLDGERQRSEDYVARTRLAIPALTEAGDLRCELLGRINLGGGLQSLGDLAGAAACYDSAMPVAEARGWTYLVALVHAGRGGLAYRLGRPAEGRARYADSFALLDAIGHRQQVAYNGLVEARACLDQGLCEQAIALLREAIAVAEALDRPQIRTPALACLATALERSGDPIGACAVWRAHAQAIEALHRQQLDTARAFARERQLRAADAQELEHAQRTRAALEAQNRELAQALETQRTLQRALEELADTDPLTGLANRRRFDALVRPALALAQRHGRSYSLILCDLDGFKAINDALGHGVGDEVLVAAAQRIRARVRHTDLCARWGGEEFCIALAETPLADAVAVAEALRRALADTPVGPVAVTASFGVAALSGADASLEALVARADAALYAAKRGGRNAVWVDAPDGPQAAERRTAP